MTPWTPIYSSGGPLFFMWDTTPYGWLSYQITLRLSSGIDGATMRLSEAKEVVEANVNTSLFEQGAED